MSKLTAPNVTQHNATAWPNLRAWPGMMAQRDERHDRCAEDRVSAVIVIRWVCMKWTLDEHWMKMHCSTVVRSHSCETLRWSIIIKHLGSWSMLVHEWMFFQSKYVRNLSPIVWDLCCIWGQRCIEPRPSDSKWQNVSENVGVLELYTGGSKPGGARAWGAIDSQIYTSTFDVQHEGEVNALAHWLCLTGVPGTLLTEEIRTFMVIRTYGILFIAATGYGLMGPLVHQSISRRCLKYRPIRPHSF